MRQKEIKENNFIPEGPQCFFPIVQGMVPHALCKYKDVSSGDEGCYYRLPRLKGTAYFFVPPNCPINKQLAKARAGNNTA